MNNRCSLLFSIRYFLFFFLCSITTNANLQDTVMIRRKRSLQSSLTLISKITASNGGINNYFGEYNAVAISNNRIVIGAYGYNNRTGAAYLFLDPANPESGRSYSQTAILTASDGETDDWFGDSVDIDGDFIVVGASYSKGGGAVYIFRIVENEIVSQVAKIKAQNGAGADYFGTSVAIHGNFILVGAYGVDMSGINTYVGSAYLFVNPSNDVNNPEWTQIMQFQPNDLTESVYFGRSVAMDDQIAVIGTWDANAAYVFVPVNDGNVNSLSLWTQMAKLTGPTDSYFGYSVAVAGNIIVVGAYYDTNINGNVAGAIYVFTKINGSSSSSSSSSMWTQTNILLAADGAEYEYFGISVAISKDASTIVMGAYWDDFNSTIRDSGAAYLFRNSNTTTTTTTTVGWTQVGKYVAADRERNDNLGRSIAMENSVVVVGADGDDSDKGSAYIIDTGYSPSPPPTAPIPTTTAPTAKPVTPTFQPTSSPTTKPTNPPATNSPTTMAPSSPNKDNNGITPSSPPATSTPTTGVPTTPIPPNNNSTSNPNDITSTSDDNNNNNNIIIAAMVVFGVVALGFGFFFYRIRVKREDRLRLEQQQQQQQQMMPPSLEPPPSWNNGMVAVNMNETPMADVIFLPVPSAEDRSIPSAEDRSMPADVLVVDPPLTQAPPTSAAAAAAAVGNLDVIDADKGLPRYKDQARTIGPPAGPSHIPSPEPMRNSQRNGDQEELPGTKEVQQQQRQQQIRDPPATDNLFQERRPTFKDQVSGE